MENIIPVSDMRFYNQSLSDVTEGAPVILTKNGAAKYAVVDINEWREIQAKLKLFEELQRGYQSLRNEKTVTRDEFRRNLGIDNEL